MPATLDRQVVPIRGAKEGVYVLLEAALPDAPAQNIGVLLIDPTTGRHLGNFPQAFTHLALINAVVHLIRAEERADYRGATSRLRSARRGSFAVGAGPPTTAADAPTPPLTS